MRLFIAIQLPPAVIAELAPIAARLKFAGDGLRWSTPETWHITLQFLGNSSPEQLACLMARIGALKLPPVSIQLDGLGSFDHAGVFFAGVKVTPKLLSLQKHVVAATELCGFVSEARPYQPHITLARSKGDAGRRGLAGLKSAMSKQPRFTSFVASEFVLFESFLGAGGARHEIRGRFALQET